MKFTSTIMAAMASGAFAQIPNIPQCAVSCFATALLSDGCSGKTDFACHCSKPELIPSVTPCVETACSADDQAAVISTVQDTCASAGVPISISTPGNTPVPLPTPDPTAPVSTPTDMESMPEITGTDASTQTLTQTVTTTPSPTDDSPTTTGDSESASAPPTTGAAAAPTAVGGGVLAVLVGAAALL